MLNCSLLVYLVLSHQPGIHEQYIERIAIGTWGTSNTATTHFMVEIITVQCRPIVTIMHAVCGHGYNNIPWVTELVTIISELAKLQSSTVQVFCFLFKIHSYCN